MPMQQVAGDSAALRPATVTTVPAPYEADAIYDDPRLTYDSTLPVPTGAGSMTGA